MNRHPTTALSTDTPEGAQLSPSADELAELDREVDAYLAFWACARDGRVQIAWKGARE